MPRKVRLYSGPNGEYAKYQGKPEQIKNRAARNSARASVVKSSGAAAVRGKDVDHKTPLSKGGSNARSNLRAVSPKTNRSFKRNSKGGMK